MVGPTQGGMLNRWWEDLSVMVSFFQPYFGMLAQSGLSLLLGLANGVLLFLLALFVAFFFYASGGRLAAALVVILHRIAGPQPDRLIEVTGATPRGVLYGILRPARVPATLS